MIFTEKEAINKTCPASLNAYCSVPGDMGAADRNCMASKCMAWRWSDPKCPPECDDPSHMRRGFCGLASKPEVEG